MHGKLDRLLRTAALTALLWLHAPAAAQTYVNGRDAAGKTAPRSEYVVHRWTTADGLPANFVSDVLQTRSGYLWVATGGGLARFDGQRFRVFTAEDLPGWTTSFATDLFETRAGTLWIVSDQGTLTRRTGSGAFETVFADGAFRARHPHFYEPRDGTLWVSGPHGRLARIDGDSTAVFTAADGLLGDTTHAINEDRDGRLWIAGSDGVARWNGARFVVEASRLHLEKALPDADGGFWLLTKDSTRGGRLRRFTDGQVTTPPAARALQQSPRDTSGALLALEDSPRSGALWMATAGGLLRRAPDGSVTTVVPGGALPDGPITGLHEDRSGQLWVQTEGHELMQLRGHQLVPVTLAGGPFDSMHAPMEDAEGNRWVGTNAGLLQLTPRPFETITTRDGLAEGFVFSILRGASGDAWLGTWGGGLYRAAPDGRLKAHYTAADGLLGNYVSTLQQGADGTLWVGGSGGLVRLQNGRVTGRWPTSGNNKTSALGMSRDGTLWVAHNQFSVLEGSTTLRPRGPAALRSAHVHDIHQAQSGALWVSTERGLFRREEDGTWRQFTPQNSTLSSASVISIIEEDDGTLWFGTRAAGFNRWTPSDSTEGDFFVYTEADGLYSSGVWQMLRDDQGRFWMSSNRGLFRLSEQELDGFMAGRVDHLTPVAYTEADGLPSAECNHAPPPGAKMPDGRLWFPTLEGVVIVDPDRVARNERPPPVHLQQMRAGGKPVDLRPRTGERPSLRSGRNNLAFRFAALSFTNPKQNRYRYKLEGYDEAWHEAGTQRRSAFYTNLPPGRYRFRVQASNGDGVWNRKGASFAFALQPRFFQTVWFYLLFIAGIVGIGYGVHWLRVKNVREKGLQAKVRTRTERLQAEKKKTEGQARKLREQRRRLLEIDHLKSRFFANLSHEFRTPLTLIQGPLRDLLDGANGDLDDEVRRALRHACRNASHLKDLIGQLLDLTRLEAGAVDLEPRRGDLAAFAEETVRAFTPWAEREAITLSCISAAARLPTAFDPERLRTVLRNLLSNALKFTPAGGRIVVTVGTAGEEALLRVRDTGPGIPAGELAHVFDRFHQVDGSPTRENEGAGIGLSLTKELVELHGGTLRAESTPGEGATFTVTLPVQERRSRRTEERKDRQSTNRRGEPSWSPRQGTEGRESKIEDGTPAAESAERADGSQGKGGSRTAPTAKILIVEDHAEVRAYLRGGLAPGYRIEEASNGIEALEKIRAERPALVLSDVMMPEMDGIELCRTLKADDDLSDLPVILLTARAGEEERVRGLKQACADDYLEKPFSMEELRARIDNLIDSRRALREKYSGEVVMQPSGVSVTSEDERFYEQARAVAEDHIDAPDFTVEQFAGAMPVGKSTLNRRLKDITGLTPAKFIRRIRLERAAQLLEQDSGAHVEEVAFAVGYRSAGHFSKLFRTHFGAPPSAYPPDEDGEETSSSAESSREA